MTTNVSNVEPIAGSDSEVSENSSVSADSYKKLLDQRKKDQARARQAEQELTELKAKAEADEAARLVEQNRYKELYEAEKKKREDTESRISQMTQSQITSAKRAELDRQLGGVKKAEYLSFADLNAIQMNEDGTVEAESVKAVANKFRETHPDLLPTKTGATLPNGAPADHKPKLTKPLSQMTTAELRAAYSNVRSKG